MKIEVKKIDKLKRIVNIVVDGPDFLEERKRVFLDIGKNIKVSGFRQGTAPLEVLERSHLKSLNEEFLKRMLPEYYRKALEEEKIIPASLPQVFHMEIDEKRVSFSVEFEVRPEVEIKDDDYKGIKVNGKKIVVKEDEIEKVITNIKESFKKLLEKDLSDEEIARWSGYPDIETFRDALKGEIYVEKLRERRKNIESTVSSQLLKIVKIDLPKSEVERYHKELVEREVYNLTSRGVSQADIEKYKPNLEEKLMSLANDQIKLSYILEAIAHKENLKTDENNRGEIVFSFILGCAAYN